MWSDIDYMKDYKDFTYNNDTYAGLPAFIDNLHKNHKRYVPIIDAGIAQREGSEYAPYVKGVQDDVFINAYVNSPDYFTGQVWPTDAVYPSFFRPAT